MTAVYQNEKLMEERQSERDGWGRKEETGRSKDRRTKKKKGVRTGQRREDNGGEKEQRKVEEERKMEVCPGKHRARRSERDSLKLPVWH